MQAHFYVVGHQEKQLTVTCNRTGLSESKSKGLAHKKEAGRRGVKYILKNHSEMCWGQVTLFSSQSCPLESRARSTYSRLWGAQKQSKGSKGCCSVAETRSRAKRPGGAEHGSVRRGRGWLRSASQTRSSHHTVKGLSNTPSHKVFCSNCLVCVFFTHESWESFALMF